MIHIILGSTPERLALAIGPFNSERKAEEMRKTLDEAFTGVDFIVLECQPPDSENLTLSIQIAMARGGGVAAWMLPTGTPQQPPRRTSREVR